MTKTKTPHCDTKTLEPCSASFGEDTGTSSGTQTPVPPPAKKKEDKFEFSQLDSPQSSTGSGGFGGGWLRVAFTFLCYICNVPGYDRSRYAVAYAAYFGKDLDAKEKPKTQTAADTGTINATPEALPLPSATRDFQKMISSFGIAENTLSIADTKTDGRQPTPAPASPLKPR
jgi:hypothetical protein